MELGAHSFSHSYMYVHTKIKSDFFLFKKELAKDDC